MNEQQLDITGEVETGDDNGRVRLYIEKDTLGRGLVFLNLDYATDEDIANVETDLAEKGWSNRAAAFIQVPFDRASARALGEYLITASL